MKHRFQLFVKKYRKLAVKALSPYKHVFLVVLLYMAFHLGSDYWLDYEETRVRIIAGVQFIEKSPRVDLKKWANGYDCLTYNFNKLLSGVAVTNFDDINSKFNDYIRHCKHDILDKLPVLQVGNKSMIPNVFDDQPCRILSIDSPEYSAETKIKSIYPQCKLHTINSTVLNESENNVKNVEKFIETDVRDRPIDYLFMTVHGYDLSLFEHIFDNFYSFPQICQINVDFVNLYTFPQNGFNLMEILYRTASRHRIFLYSFDAVDSIYRAFFISTATPRCESLYFNKPVNQVLS